MSPLTRISSALVDGIGWLSWRLDGRRSTLQSCRNCVRWWLRWRWFAALACCSMGRRRQFFRTEADFGRAALAMISAQGGIFGWVAPSANYLSALASADTTVNA